MATATPAQASADTPPLGTVLVTGGCGFLGSHIVSLILSRYPSPDTTVHVLDLNTSRNTHPGATYHTADLTSHAAVRKVLDAVQPTVVLHTASPVFGAGGQGGEARQRALMHSVNVGGTKVLLEHARSVGVRAFVYTSSASVVSDCRLDLINADERWNLIRGSMQAEYYSDTKAEAEQLVLAANTRPSTLTSFPLLTCALRPASMFGEHDVQFLPNLLKVLKSSRTGFQLGDNDNLFDTTYVGNAAHAHLLAADSLLATWNALTLPAGAAEHEKAALAARDRDGEKADGEAFVITNGEPVYFWDFTRAAWQGFARAGKAVGVAYPAPATLAKTRTLSFSLAVAIAAVMGWVFWLLRLGQPSLSPPQVRYSCMTRYYRIDKAKSVLGYKPVWTLEQGLAKSTRWFAERDAEEAGKKGR